MSELDDLREQVARLTAMMAAKPAPPPTEPRRRERPEPTPPPPTPRADEDFERCRVGRHVAYAKRWPLPEQAANGASIPYDNPLCENCGASVVYSKPFGTTDAMILEKLRRSGVDLILPERATKKTA